MTKPSESVAPRAALTALGVRGPSFVPPTDDGSDRVSAASRRLRALALLSGSLTDPLTPSDAADVVERQALSVLGATSAVVVTLGGDSIGPRTALVEIGAAVAPAEAAVAAYPAQALVVVHSLGTPAHVAAALQQLSFDAPVPLAEVARTGESVFLSSESEMLAYAEWCRPILSAGVAAAAAVPVWANGHLRGVLGLTWATPRAFDEDERAFVLTLGVMCAQAIMRGHLAAAERSARDAAVHANRAKMQFLHTMSHELRTPLNAMLGYTDLLAEEIVGPITSEQQAHFRRLRRSGHHLLSLVEELLRFARLDAGKEVVRVERVLAADVIEETLDVIRPLAEGKGVRIRFDSPVDPVELETDRLKLRQILVNLVTNAVKYTDAGSVTVILRFEGLAAEMRIEFEVIDTGRGVSVGDQAHLFEAFWRGEAAHRDGSSGTGLGLSVARQLARLLGGDVTMATTELGRGSTFVASLPARYSGESVIE